jgi:predicted Zn-dependent peptidase
MYRDNPQRHIWDVFEKLLYGDQPAGWDIAGEKETVNSLNREKIVDYFNSHYIASNTIVAVAGDIEHEPVRKKVEEYFSSIRKAEKLSKLAVVEHQTEPTVALEWKETDQGSFVLGFRSHNMFDSRKYAESILATILGGWMSSRLFIEVRDKRGLAYHVSADTSYETDTGFFSIYAGVNNLKAEEALKVILSEIMKIKHDGVTPYELQKAKDYAEGRMVMGLENSQTVAQAFAWPVLFENKILTPEDELAKIKAVTLEDIQQVASEMFQENKMNFAIIGPFKDAEVFKKLLKLS